MLKGLRKGLTVLLLASSALHFTTLGLQVTLGQGAGIGHCTGFGQMTGAHLGRGQGGQSPTSLFPHLLLSMMTGWGLGIEDLNTYLLRSGTGGTSLFNI